MLQLLEFLHKRIITEKRCNYNSEQDDDIDRISNLPDELRVHILTFLRIKEAVQTCVLSKRWKKTWASLPILLFDLNEFLFKDLHHKLSREIKREHVDKFEKFVKSVLQNREASDLSHFILSSVIKDSVSCNGFLLRALEFKSRNLGVRDNKLLNSNEIFTCASLQEVFFFNIGDRNMEIAPNSVQLPRLKRLDLCNVTVNDDFLNKLFLGCPIVEEVALYRCILKASRISSGRLKRLTLYSCDFSKSGPDLINSLSEVTWLHLTVRGSEVKGFFNKGPIFKKLKRLKLGGWCLNSDFDLVSFFLRSPNLEMLTLFGYKLKPREVADDKSNWEEPKVMMVQREQLEKVNIRKEEMSSKWVDQLQKNLRAHVKTIGKINIV